MEQEIGRKSVKRGTGNMKIERKINVRTVEELSELMLENVQFYAFIGSSFVVSFYGSFVRFS